jgi:hypothetical protein
LKRKKIERAKLKKIKKLRGKIFYFLFFFGEKKNFRGKFWGLGGPGPPLASM